MKRFTNQFRTELRV